MRKAAAEALSFISLIGFEEANNGLENVSNDFIEALPTEITGKSFLHDIFECNLEGWDTVILVQGRYHSTCSKFFTIRPAGWKANLHKTKD